MFRSFIYLDQEKMYSYLRQIDADYANQPVELSRKKTRGGSFGTDFLGVNAGIEIEEKREVTKDVIKDYDRFEKKLEELSGSEYFDLALDDYDLNTVPRMSIIRVNGSFEIPEKFDMFSVAQKFMPLITSQIETSSDNERELMEAFLGKASADIPIVMEDEEVTIASKLSILRRKCSSIFIPLIVAFLIAKTQKTATPHKMRNCGLYLSFYDTKSKITQ